MTNSLDVTDKNKRQHFDVVISGGGLSGALMALSLADLKQIDGSLLSIAIVESNAILKDPSPSFDDRVLALSHGSAAYLEKLGAWQTLKNNAEAIKKIHVSDRGHYGKARLSADDYQVSALGYVVEMSLIGQSLLTALAGKKNITWFSPDKITAVNWQTNQVVLTLASELTLSASLLLACDGAQSPCRSFANIKAQAKPYFQSALIANVSTQKAHQNIAYERFTEHGPIAMLPLSASSHSDSALRSEKNNSGRCSLVWTLPPELAQKMYDLTDDDFKKQLVTAFGSWLGNITHVGKRDIYPLSLLQADQQIYHRMALIGNASHTIHPIAGQGFNLGVRDVSQLAKLVKIALDTEQDIGAMSLLNQYAQQRKQDQNQVITLTDSLVTLFSNNLPALVVGRGVGLKVLNYLSPVKKALVNKTMGY
jgi:2-octaprenyl-6-methoxyphenol hydroxylase